MEIILAIIFLLLCGLVVLVIEFWWLILIIGVVAAVIGLIIWAAYNNNLNKVISARVVREEPIIKRVSEKTGHTTSYGRHLSYHEHYRDRDAITGYKVVFAVEYVNGKKGTITCKEGDYTYNKLIAKI